MFCRNCDAQLADGAIACTKCGMAPLSGRQFCNHCGAPTQPQAVVCLACGGGLAQSSSFQLTNRIAAGLCALLLGPLGVHKFIMGYTNEGIIMLVATIVGSIVTFGIAGFVMWIIGIIEGITYLTKSDAEFEAIYGSGRKGWF